MARPRPLPADLPTGAAAGEPLEHALFLRLGYPWTAIGDLDHQLWRCRGDADLHWILVAGIVARVVEQVGERLAQGDRIAEHQGIACQCSQVELDRRAYSARLGALRHLAQEYHEVDRLAARHLAAMAHHGVAQELVGDLARQGGVAVDLVHIATQHRRIVLLDRKLGLRTQGGEGRAHLMSGIGEKGLHQRKRGLQPLHEPVEPSQELADLRRRRGDDGRQITGLALPDQPLDGQERRERPAHAEPDQARRHQDDEQDRQKGVGEDVGCERAPLVAGVGYNDRDFWSRGFGHQSTQGHCPDRCAEVAGVDEARTVRGSGWDCRSEVRIAGDQAPIGASNPIEDTVAPADREQGQRRIGQIDIDCGAVDLDRIRRYLAPRRAGADRMRGRRPGRHSQRAEGRRQRRAGRGRRTAHPKVAAAATSAQCDASSSAT